MSNIKILKVMEEYPVKFTKFSDGSLNCEILDSGDPVKVLCGTDYVVKDGLYYSRDLVRQEKRTRIDLKYGVTKEDSITEQEAKGLVQCLIELFGYETNELGYKVLDPHVGAIYGGSITLESQQEIHKRLLEKGIAPTVVLV